jgi:F-type H+-transporting ATPase subunit a
LLIVIKFKINLVLILDTKIKNVKMLQNLNLIINSPLEQFEVSSLISVIAPILGYINITLSNLGLYSILILFIILSLHIISNNENKILPSK